MIKKCMCQIRIIDDPPPQQKCLLIMSPVNFNYKKSKKRKKYPYFILEHQMLVTVYLIAEVNKFPADYKN